MSGPSELDIALARPDVAQLQVHVSAYVSSGGSYSRHSDDTYQSPDRHDDAMDRIFESPYNDPDRLLAYIALIAAQREALQCHEAMAMGHIDAFFGRLNTANITIAEFDPIFDRMIAAARNDDLWSSMLRTSAWWSLPKRYRDQLVEELDFPADE